MSTKAMSQDLFADKRMGFFIYLGVEAIMFSTLFATYIIYTPAPVGPHPSEIFEMKTTVLASIFLLSSSGTIFIAEKGLDKRSTKMIIAGIIFTFLLGATFMYFEMHEFHKFIKEGHLISTSNFLSSYYVLVGLHASHVVFGLGWMIILLIQLKKQPFQLFKEKHKVFIYYWHFVDIIWVFIISIVYAPYLL
ncbi:cytochrome c oxidase subunit 3 [Thalassobacillus pellis]|uniref:cytochrome c oxidase subunit 3 n=1 Tax=Thalassobacillus pellis TaxID=748008 RepID=UPI00195FDD8C|nr:cytochrome c oxidase subunit 3 [Thalassobacillus pellis]MBM7551830.1 heme/copper-type cytochrome/quinol oxidase subunit 3 [Thalassobacillus pellis]